MFDHLFEDNGAGCTWARGVRREARVRRALRRKGEFLRKYRTRSQDIDRLYMIVNSSNWIVDGANFELTLEQVEAHASLSRPAD